MDPDPHGSKSGSELLGKGINKINIQKKEKGVRHLKAMALISLPGIRQKAIYVA
jgi:hypothetical protein